MDFLDSLGYSIEKLLVRPSNASFYLISTSLISYNSFYFNFRAAGDSWEQDEYDPDYDVNNEIMVMLLQNHPDDADDVGNAVPDEEDEAIIEELVWLQLYFYKSVFEISHLVRRVV